jgi:hypothetical protein
VPDLFFVGPASANSFGPIMRFACGADWTARRITMRLARHAREKAALPFLQAARGGASTGP